MAVTDPAPMRRRRRAPVEARSGTRGASAFLFPAVPCRTAVVRWAARAYWWHPRDVASRERKWH
jgi:hypothetical protein